MNLKKLFYYICLTLTPLFLACEGMLEEPAFSQLEPGIFLSSKEGVESLLYGAFAEGYLNGYEAKCRNNLENWSTDLEWQTAGGENRIASQMINFTWDSSLDWLFGMMWLRPYRAIRNVNVLLENLDNANISTELKILYGAEARFIRALSYSHLYSWFGPVPLRTGSSDRLDLQRATDQEMRSFIQAELLDIIPNLSLPGNELNYGRPNSGAARALLCKFYLNTKQWQRAADMAQEVIEMEYYSLYPDYTSLFKVENERNREFILVNPHNPFLAGMNYMNGALPPGFSLHPPTGLKMQSNWANWAAQYRLYDRFYNSFSDSDLRKDLIISSYINSQGKTVSLLNNNNTRSFKYWPDPNAIGNQHGNDESEIRYADILLSRAEALNELNGPNQESIDLINQVRVRAGLIAEDISLNNFLSSEALREHLLNERAWEFYGEVGIRREDQIRMGTFISSALERGHSNAQPFRKIFPIPQDAMDANPNLEQNPNY
jgi:hypothetical protein